MTLPTVPGSSLISLTPIYDYLKTRGGRVEDEYIVLGDWPVQFLPPSDELEREAVEQAVSTGVEGVATRVMTAEHLVAIALRTGRTKDRNRILQFIEQNAVDRGKLRRVIESHGLASKWKRFEQKYSGDANE